MDSHEPGVLMLANCRKLLAGALDCKDGLLLPCVAVSLFAGLRPPELSRLTWGRVDLSEKTITLDGSMAKTRQRRIVKLPDNCVDWLLPLAPEHPDFVPAAFQRHFDVSRQALQALPARQLLASSDFAIAGALKSISNRLKAKLQKKEPAESLEDELDKDYESLDETAEEWSDDQPAEPLSDAGSLFEDIKKPGSGIRILAGAKKFTEGWSSWRVSAMGLMNVGKKEGSEIIQLFGCGVRLKGYKFKLKRTSALDALDFQGDDVPRKHPDHIALLETLNIFGIKSDYMKEFEEYLEAEGVGDDERRELIFLPTIKLPEFERGELELHIIRPRAEMPDFKKAVKLTLSSLEGKLNNLVLADWYPRLQKQSSTLRSGGAAAEMNKEPLKKNHLAFLDWNTIWFELERHKRDKAYYNLLFGPLELSTMFKSSWWYEFYIPPGYLDFRFDRMAKSSSSTTSNPSAKQRPQACWQPRILPPAQSQIGHCDQLLHRGRLPARLHPLGADRRPTRQGMHRLPRSQGPAELYRHLQQPEGAVLP